MASGIHTVPPQIINEPFLFNHLPKDIFQEKRDYFQYGENPDLCGFINNFNGGPARISDTLTHIAHVPVTSCNNSIIIGEPAYLKYDEGRENKNLHECLIEENFNFSSSVKENNGKKGNKYKHSSGNKKRNGNDQNENCHRPCTNLYQPIFYQPKSNKCFFRAGHHTRFFKNTEDIERKVHGLMKRFQSRAHKLKIDFSPEILLNGGPWDALNQSVWDVFTSKIQKEETYIEKLNVWKEIFLFFKICLSNYGLYLVGSTMTGFALQGSDIDICLLSKPLSNEPRIDSLHQLNYLHNALMKNGLASEAELVMAKVPILKFTNKGSGFKIDLNCNNIVGIQNTRLLYCYAQLDWRVRPLVAIIKVWAQANNINDAKNMTISSYSWTLMVIHYLQCGVFPPVLPCLHTMYPNEFNTYQDNRSIDVQGEIVGLAEYVSENRRCLGDLLIGFFHYYSYFNYQYYAISVRTASRLPVEICKQVKSPKNDPHHWKFLCIEEPFDLSNTAKSVFDADIFKHIRHVILLSYKELASNKALDHIIPLVNFGGCQ